TLSLSTRTGSADNQSVPGELPGSRQRAADHLDNGTRRRERATGTDRRARTFGSPDDFPIYRHRYGGLASSNVGAD
ncbi:MAG TPA: hypothetical protein VFD73_19950, partial [Gemmatimonadales bacterium]|nr:hypothetical protein [Gemmatimonadales bacterium]